MDNTRSKDNSESSEEMMKSTSSSCVRSTADDSNDEVEEEVEEEVEVGEEVEEEVEEVWESMIGFDNDGNRINDFLSEETTTSLRGLGYTGGSILKFVLDWVDKRRDPDTTSRPEKWWNTFYEYIQLIMKEGVKYKPHHTQTKIYDWMKNTIKLRKKGTLSNDKILLLDAVGFIWHPNLENWMENYSALKQFRADNDNVFIA